MSDVVIGTCSLCGGQVILPNVRESVFPPVPQCAQCGATAAQHGPVIPMERSKYWTTASNNSGETKPIGGNT